MWMEWNMEWNEMDYEMEWNMDKVRHGWNEWNGPWMCKVNLQLMVLWYLIAEKNNFENLKCQKNSDFHLIFFV